MKCFLCGEYGESEIAHDESETHRFNYFNSLKEQNKNRKNLKLEQQIHIDRELEKIQTYYDSNMVYECGNQYSDKGCEFEGTLEEVLAHEKHCLKFTRDLCIPCETPKKKTYSDAKATCGRCGKVFLHTCKTSLPQHQLNRHQKTCKGKLPYKQRVKDFMNVATDEQLKKLFDFMNSL
jgi:hypothetical protein